MELRKKKKRDDVIFSIFLIIVTTASFLPFIEQTKDLAFLADEFRFQYFLASTLVFIITIFKKRFKTSLIALILAVFNIALIASHIDFFEKNSLYIKQESNVSFMLHRVSNQTWSESQILFDNIKKKNKDIIFVVDASYEIIKNLNNFSNKYEFIRPLNCFNESYCLILSRLEAQDYGEIPLSKNNKALWVSYLSDNKLFTVVVFNEGHLKAEYADKNIDLTKLIDFINSRDEPVILVGGFASVPWSRRFLDFERSAGLSSKGGLAPNWPSILPWILRLPLDHIYAHPGISLSSLHLQTSAGSDYRSIVGEILISK